MLIAESFKRSPVINLSVIYICFSHAKNQSELPLTLALEENEGFNSIGVMKEQISDMP